MFKYCTSLFALRRAGQATWPLCVDCEQELPWLDEQCVCCALPMALSDLLCSRCDRDPPAFDKVVVPWHYGFPLDAMISRFKHRSQWPLGRLMAQLLAQAVLYRYGEGLPRPDALLPVPLARARLRQRGFNQSAMLARWLSRPLAVSCDEAALMRARETTAQQTLDAKGRRQNLRQAFTLAPGKRFAGRHVALVDDVLTTGSTAQALAALLRQAGAARGRRLLPGTHTAAKPGLTWRRGWRHRSLILQPVTCAMSLPTLLAQHIFRRPQRIALLQHIAEQGSITRAAKAAGISYKSAWDAIDELNNLAAQPLVERSAGGRGGGGARLTDEGQRVLRLYQRLQALQEQVLESAESSSDLDLLGRLMLRTRARNQLLGQISALRREGRHDRVSLALGGGLQIDALVTPDSTERLELAPGTTVVALLKAGWVKVLGEGDSVDEGSNCLEAVVEHAEADDAGEHEVRLSLGNGQTLCAFAQGLAVGTRVRAQFHPSFVLIGVPA